MASLLTPSRRRGEEILDGPGVDPRVVTRSLADVAKANSLFGGRSAALAELRRAIPDLPAHASLLDVGTGTGDIPAAAAKLLAENGITLSGIGLDVVPALAELAHRSIGAAVCANALEIPVRSHSVDVVLCSQFLHHLLLPDAEKLIREMNRVARVRVVISDLHRNWIAAGGFWAVSFPLRLHPISRHDGLVSVLRGFTKPELHDIIQRSLGIDVQPTYRRGFRITAGWKPVRD